MFDLNFHNESLSILIVSIYESAFAKPKRRDYSRPESGTGMPSKKRFQHAPDGACIGAVLGVKLPVSIRTAADARKSVLRFYRIRILRNMPIEAKAIPFCKRHFAGGKSGHDKRQARSESGFISRVTGARNAGHEGETAMHSAGRSGNPSVGLLHPKKKKVAKN